MPAWSLSVEAFFYLAFPSLLRLTKTLGAIFTMASAYLLILLRHLLSPDWPNGPYFPLYHICSFVIGVGAGLWFRTVRPPRQLAGVYCATFGLVLSLAFRQLIPAVCASEVFLIPLFTWLIVAVASCAGYLQTIEVSLFVLLGEASYSVYILHLPIYYLFQSAARTIGLTADGNFAVLLVFLTLLVFLSILSFRFIEVPAKQLILGKTRLGSQ